MKGIAPLIDDVQRHRQFLRESGEWQQKEAARLRRDVHALIREALLTRWWEKLDENQFAQILDDVIHRKYSPIEAVEKLL